VLFGLRPKTQFVNMFGPLARSRKPCK
jgi:hypothetical protein